MSSTYADFMQDQSDDVKTDRIRDDIAIALTDEQYSNLKLKAYKAGFKNPGDFIQSFVADLTGWCSNGSDERDLAGQWYERAYGMSEFYYFFHYFLYNYDYDLESMSEMLENDEYFNEVYDEYLEEAYGKDVQSKEECVQLLKEIVECGIEL